MYFSREHSKAIQQQQTDSPTMPEASSTVPQLQPTDKKSWKVVGMLISVSVLIGALSMTYYFVLALPQQERTRTVLYSLALARIERQIATITQKAEQEKRHKAAATQSAKENCLLTARQTYENTWAEKCQSAAELLTTRLHACSATATQEQCTKRWGTIDSSASCALSPAIATPINESYARVKEECFQHYSPGETMVFSAR